MLPYIDHDAKGHFKQKPYGLQPKKIKLFQQTPFFAFVCLFSFGSILFALRERQFLTMRKKG